MKILDLYIIRKYLSTFIFILLIIMMLAIVFDISENMDVFSKGQVSWGDIMKKYYLNFFFHYANLFSSFIAFLSVMFFTSMMARHTEIVPMLNSGISFNRYLRPYLIGASIIVAFSLYMQHMVIPSANKTRLEFERIHFQNGGNTVLKNFQRDLNENQIIYFNELQKPVSQIRRLWIINLHPETKRPVKSLTAATAKGDSTNNNWVLYDAEIRTFKDSLSQEYRQVKTLDTSFSFGIRDFNSSSTYAQQLNTPDLLKFIAKEKAAKSEHVTSHLLELHQRSSFPIATFILTIIAVCLTSNSSRKDTGVNVIIGLTCAVSYFFLIKITTVAALNIGFSAFWAVWTPNLLFAGIAFIIYKRAVR